MIGKVTICFKMKGLSRGEAALLDEHARIFDELGHIVLGRYRVDRKEVLRTESRLKSHESIWRHLDRGQALSDLVDLSAFRIITVFSDTVERVVSQITGRFPSSEVIRQDKSNGYRTTKLEVTLSKSLAHSLGINLNFEEIKFEVQVRTAMQHLWAALDREFVYDQRAEDDSLVALFRNLARAANMFDDSLLEVRQVAEAQVALGKRAGRVTSVDVPISPETILGAIKEGTAAVKFDHQIVEDRRDKQGLVETTTRRVARTSAILRYLGFRYLNVVLAQLVSDKHFRHWLKIYNERPLVQGGRRSSRHGDTLSLFAEYLAAGRGLETLRGAFRHVGAKDHSIADRLYREVHQVFLANMAKFPKN